MRIHVIAGALLAATIAACATSPTPPAQAVQVPSERRFPLPPAAGPSGEVLIVRDSGFLGSGCFMDLHVNRVRVARMGPGERIEVPVPAGEVLLRVGRDPSGTGLCAAHSEGQWKQRETAVKQGERKTFRLLMDSSFEVDIVRAEAD
jgi:hypothetical protein